MWPAGFRADRHSWCQRHHGSVKKEYRKLEPAPFTLCTSSHDVIDPGDAAPWGVYGAMIASEVTSALLERIRLHAMPDGPVECRGTWLRQQGEMRFEPDRPWLPFRAEQWFIGDGVDFRWAAQVRMAPLVRARVIDAFEGGKGSLIARIFGIFRVAHSRGPVTDRAEAMRGLAELPWRPYAFRERSPLVWEEVGPNQLRVAFHDVAVVLDVDANGTVVGTAAANRPLIGGKTVVETPWVGVFTEYETFEGLRVPTRAEASWVLAEGLFTYWRGRVVEFRVLR